jgi:hypothetical protein
VKKSTPPRTVPPPGWVTVRPFGTYSPVSTSSAACGPLLVTVTVMVPLPARVKEAGALSWIARSARAVPAEVTVSTKVVWPVPEVAVTMTGPVDVPACRAGAVATSEELVVAVAVWAVPPKLAVPPVPAAMPQVTVAPSTGLPEASVTVTDSGVANCCTVAADWLLPVSIFMPNGPWRSSAAQLCGSR